MENEIIKDFKGIYKNRSIKLGFLKKYTRIDLYISKKTGCLIPGYFHKNKKNIEVWEKRYLKKNFKFRQRRYTSTSPHFLSRHIYTIEQVKNSISFKNLKIADLGCGDAGLINLLSKLHKHKEIYGFDTSKQNVKLNKRKLKNKIIKFVNSSIENIDDKKYKEYFDVVFLTWTLGSSSEPLKLLEKIYKIVKKNGYVVVAESSRILVPPNYTLDYYFRLGKKMNTFLNYPWRFSFNSLRNLLLVFNFKVVSFNDYVHNDNLVVIAKKSQSIFKRYKIDNYKTVYTFFKKWKKHTELFR